MFELNLLSPVFLEIGPLKFHYYGLMYALGFLISYLFLKNKLLKNKKISESNFDKFFFGTVIFALIGGRLGHVFIYNPDYFFTNPFEILAVWNGGMASHGGFLGAVFGFFIFKPKKIPFFRLADLTILTVPIGLALGRIGNFINGELYGKITNLPWCVKFADELCRHPTQLYAVAKDTLIFLLLFWLFRKKKKDGFVFAAFLISYGILRFFVEFFKEKTTGNNHLDFLTTGQILSIGMLFIGVGLFIGLPKNKQQ